MPAFRLFVDSANGVDVDPEYNYAEKHQKFEARHRTKSGNEYVYRFGGYKQFKFSVMYVDSSFKSIVNSYWDSNTELLFMEVGDTQVFSVRVMNKELPIGSPIKPSTTEFKGVIELSTY